MTEAIRTEFTFTLPKGYVDKDGNPNNGCECMISSPVDDCDGVDSDCAGDLETTEEFLEALDRGRFDAPEKVGENLRLIDMAMGNDGRIYLRDLYKVYVLDAAGTGRESMERMRQAVDQIGTAVRHGVQADGFAELDPVFRGVAGIGSRMRGDGVDAGGVIRDIQVLPAGIVLDPVELPDIGPGSDHAPHPGSHPPEE